MVNLRNKKCCLGMAVVVCGLLLVSSATVQAASIAEYTFEPGTYTGTGASLVIYDQELGDTVANDGTFAKAGTSVVTDAVRGSVLEVADEGSGGMFVDIDSTTQSYTFATWYKGTDTPGYLIDQQSSRFILELGQVKVYSASGNGWTGTANYVTGHRDDAWHHIAFVLDGTTDEWSFYLDAVAQDLDPAAGEQTSIALGDVPNLSSSGTQIFFSRYTDNMGVMFGLFDNLMVFDHAMTGAELTTLYDDQYIPEPATMLLLGLGGLLTLRRKK